MKQFKGKAIYNPSGKAGEYAQWACNFYVGCSNGCEYCYCKKGRLAGTMGGDKAVLKKCFRDEQHAMDIFCTEMATNERELQQHGLFFSFTTDPLLPETYRLTLRAMELCLSWNIPVKILTKRVDWNILLNIGYLRNAYKNLSFGFTLTGHDELEPGASTNAKRINTMRFLHEKGFKTFASIEPIIDVNASLLMIQKTVGFCDLYKIGLMAGKKYDQMELLVMMRWIEHDLPNTPIYYKDSFLKQSGITREELPANCVGRDYKLHEETLMHTSNCHG